LYYASLGSPEVQKWIETEFPDEMEKVLSDQACRELYEQLTKAQLRDQGFDIDQAEELLRGEETIAAAPR
jgi:hypothetical protein